MHAADDIYQLVPRGTLPHGEGVMMISGEETVAFLIEEDTPLTDVVAKLNKLGTHIVRHGLWIPQPEQHTPPRLRHAS